MQQDHSLQAMLKTVRNAAASAAAWTLYRAPALETPYAYAAHAALGVPGVHTLFRETTDRLVARLVSGNRALRRVRIGPVAPVFDVSSFTVKGQYFAHVTYEPGATGAVLNDLRDGDVFVDVGANSGYFTVLAALRVGAARARVRLRAQSGGPAPARTSRRDQRDRGSRHGLEPRARRRRSATRCGCSCHAGRRTMASHR